MFSTLSSAPYDPLKVRNVAIIAHVDHGSISVLFIGAIYSLFFIDYKEKQP